MSKLIDIINLIFRNIRVLVIILFLKQFLTSNCKIKEIRTYVYFKQIWNKTKHRSCLLVNTIFLFGILIFLIQYENNENI